MSTCVKGEKVDYRVSRKILKSASVLACGTVFLSLVAFTPLKKAALPFDLAGLKLVRTLTDEEAKKEVSKMHGRTMRLEDALVAHYQAADDYAILWLAQTKDKAAADGLLAAMVTGISRGGSPFSPPKEIKVRGVRVYSTSGMGQRHFFYATGNKIIWLQAGPDRAVKALHQVVADFR